MSTHRTVRTSLLAGFGLAALAGPLIVGQPAARANTYTVTTFADVVNVFDGVTSLREAVLNANIHAGDDTIVLAPGTYNLTLCTGPLSHADGAALVIEGNGATVVQTCVDTGVIESTDDLSSLTLTDLGIIGGPNSGAFVFGPGVYGEGAVHLDTVTVTGVDGGPTGAGAAVQGSNNMPGAPMTVVDSTITGNDSDGVVGSNVSFVLTDSTITENGGAGVNLTDGTPGTIAGSEISRNGEYGLRTTGQGHTRVTVTDSELNDNGSTGLVCSACGSLDLVTSQVNGNGDGGIDFSYDLDPVGPDRYVRIDSSEVNDNSASGPGGGISVTKGSEAPASDDVSPILTILTSTINDNATTASGQPGGGVYSVVGKLRIEGSTVKRNVAGGSSGSHGGGVYYAPESDGLSSARHGATIIDSTIGANTAHGNGGGSYLDSNGAVQVINTKVTKNTALTRAGRGGGLWLREASPLLVEDTTVASNQAALGGGIHVAGRNGLYWGVIADTTIDRNRATTSGGGVLVAERAQVTLRNATISANRADVRGGGLQAGTSAAPVAPVQGVTLDFTTMRGNRAPVGANLGASNGVITVRTSVLVAATGPNCTFGAAATLAAGGYTFTDAAACAGHPTDVVSVADPMLGALADNGGPTRTHLPAATSPLVNLVPLAACIWVVDQRGQTRPQGAGCEPGSVEVAGKRRS